MILRKLAVQSFFMAKKVSSRLLELLLITLIVKVMIFIIIYLASNLLPFCYECYANDLEYLPVYPWSSWLSFSTWDARHYSYLVDTGYHGDMASNAFYPLFPILVFLLRLIIPNTLLAGFIVSNLASLAAVALFFLLVKKLYSEEVAFHSGLFMLLFPTGFYLSLMYSESLFLAFVFGFFYLWESEEYSVAALVAFLLSLARPLGVLVLVPVVVDLVWQWWKFHSLQKLGRNVLLIVASTLGFGAYLLFMYFTTGAIWQGFEAQRFFIAENSLTNLLHPWAWLEKNFLSIELTLHSFTTSLIDRLFFFGYLCGLAGVYKFLEKRYFWYALVMGLIPALLGSFMAYTRYLLVVFPLFILLAIISGKKSPYVAIPFLMLQMLFLIMHVLNFWIA